MMQFPPFTLGLSFSTYQIMSIFPLVGDAISIFFWIAIKTLWNIQNYLAMFYSRIVLRRFIHEHGTLHPRFKCSFVVVIFFPLSSEKALCSSYRPSHGVIILCLSTSLSSLLLTWGSVDLYILKKSTVNVPDLDCCLLWNSLPDHDISLIWHLHLRISFKY